MLCGVKMKKMNIVKSNEDFDNIIKNGKILKNRYYVIYYIDKQKANYRVGIAIPKKTGIAVKRNKIKRQIRDILDKNNDKLKKIDYIIIVRNAILDLDYKQMEKNLITLLDNI